MQSAFEVNLSILLLVAVCLFSSCKSVSYNVNVNELVREANYLLDQERSIAGEWRDEFVSVFTLENREKFLSNRVFLRPHAENQLRLSQKQKSLLSAAIIKLEKASEISVNDKEKRFTSLMAKSLKKDIEIIDSFIEVMNFILDEKMTDKTILKSKFLEAGELSESKAKERDQLQNEAMDIIGER